MKFLVLIFCITTLVIAKDRKSSHRKEKLNLSYVIGITILVLIALGLRYLLRTAFH